MPRIQNISPAVLITVLGAFLSGGLAGSVFNWFINKAEPTIVTYNLSRTPLAVAEASALIPNLRIQVGAQTIQALYAYTIEFDVPQGPRVERAEVGIFFPHKIQVYGKSTEAPSALHEMSCQDVDNGFRCQLIPITRSIGKNYRIVIATDENQSPSVEMIAKDIDLMTTAEFVARKSRIWGTILSARVLSQVVIGILLAAAFGFMFSMQLKLVKRFGAPVIVGKVTDSEGRPIKDVDVELMLEFPERTFRPVQTDRYGDFISGRYGKISFLRGRIRIEHPDYISVEREIDSPIVYQQLQKA